MKMMNENDEILLETLKVMRDLQAQGFNLYKEINLTTHLLLVRNGIPKKLLEKKQDN